MSDKVLVDTSVWIAFFRNADPGVSERLSGLLRKGVPAYTGLIETELRRGAKSPVELQVLRDLFRSISYVPMEEAYFTGAGDMGRTLLQKGVSVGTIDLLLAHIAIQNGIALYSLDRHFTSIAKHLPLNLI